MPLLERKFSTDKNNKIWLGATGNGNDTVFGVSNGAKVNEKDRAKAARLGYAGNYTRLGNSCWFTSIEHGHHPQPLVLMTMADNLRFSKHKELKSKTAYDRYDNYAAIEVPFTDAIPSDYDGIMGMPISFLIKYCPEQFTILGATESEGKGFSNNLWDQSSNVALPLVNGERKFKRIFIKYHDSITYSFHQTGCLQTSDRGGRKTRHIQLPSLRHRRQFQ